MMLWLLAQEGAEHAEQAVEHAAVMALNWLPAATSLVVFLTAFLIPSVLVSSLITEGLHERETLIRDAIYESAASQASA